MFWLIWIFRFLLLFSLHFFRSNNYINCPLLRIQCGIFLLVKRLQSRLHKHYSKQQNRIITIYCEELCFAQLTEFELNAGTAYEMETKLVHANAIVAVFIRKKKRCRTTKLSLSTWIKPDSNSKSTKALMYLSLHQRNSTLTAKVRIGSIPLHFFGRIKRNFTEKI